MGAGAQQAGQGQGVEMRPWAPILTLALLAFAVVLLPAEAEAAPSKFIYELCDPALPGGAKPATSLSGPYAIAVNGFDTCEQQGGSVGNPAGCIYERFGRGRGPLRRCP